MYIFIVFVRLNVLCDIFLRKEQLKFNFKNNFVRDFKWFLIEFSYI